MEKSESKKLIPLYLQDYFFHNTDSEHFVRMQDILCYLETKGIIADRRTIYSAISILNTYGFEIVGLQEKGNYKYHHPNRKFDTNELKMLIDAVSASKFLTERRSKEIIEKIKTLGSKYVSKSLNRNVVLNRRIKTMNDKVLHNLDIIYSAISNNKAISFKYVNWNYQKKLVYLRDGAKYIVSPFAITLSDDNYYLIAYDHTFSNNIRHYRIDKMEKIMISSDDREGKDIFKTFDIVDYTKRSFNMFGGDDETVSLKISNKLIGAIIDRFGEDVFIRPDFDKADSFIARINVKVSDQFFAWLSGLGTGTEILSPSTVRDNYIKYLKGIISLYD